MLSLQAPQLLTSKIYLAVWEASSPAISLLVRKLRGSQREPHSLCQELISSIPWLESVLQRNSQI